MKFLLIRERTKKRKLKKKEKIVIALKLIAVNKNIAPLLRWVARLRLTAIYKNSSGKTKNRCYLTGRKRSYYRFFKLSRIKARDLALSKNLLYLKKK